MTTNVRARRAGYEFTRHVLIFPVRLCIVILKGVLWVLERIDAILVDVQPPTPPLRPSQKAPEYERVVETHKSAEDRLQELLAATQDRPDHHKYLADVLRGDPDNALDVEIPDGMAEHWADTILDDLLWIQDPKGTFPAHYERARASEGMPWMTWKGAAA